MKIKLFVLALLAAILSVIGVSPAQAADDVTSVTHSTNSERAGLYVKKHDGLGDYTFITLQQGETSAGWTGHTNYYWPSDYLVPDGYCARISIYEYRGGPYILTKYRTAGWQTTSVDNHSSVALYAC